MLSALLEMKNGDGIENPEVLIHYARVSDVDRLVDSFDKLSESMRQLSIAQATMSHRLDSMSEKFMDKIDNVNVKLSENQIKIDALVKDREGRRAISELVKKSPRLITCICSVFILFFFFVESGCHKDLFNAVVKFERVKNGNY